MNSVPFQPAPPPPPPQWLPMLPPDPPESTLFWNMMTVRDQLNELQHNLSLAKLMERELEALMMVKDSKGAEGENAENGSINPCISEVLKYLEDRRMDLESQEPISIEEANTLISELSEAMEPFRFVFDERSPWEEKSAMVSLAGKVNKSKRNKLWRKRKRQCVAEMRAKERECFDQADREANEWTAREAVKDVAKQRVEKMKDIAKVKAKEERRRLESELELIFIVEKLQELRSIRIQKLKKQGHFLPEEDDKFLEKVRAAVEEEERQALAAADTDAAKDAIATAEESKKIVKNQDDLSKGMVVDNPESKEVMEKVSSDVAPEVAGEKGPEGQSHGSAFENVASLPIEYYHYYHGSNYDMGTLIEVRRAWDVYISPGGSRIPGHWVQPPPPANEIWASYLVNHK